MQPSVENHFAMFVLLALAFSRTAHSIAELILMLYRQRNNSEENQ